MQRTASVSWSGPLRGGEGRITAASGALQDLSYSYATRSGEQVGTNPEELIASAHAGCFTMALSSALEKAGLKSDTLHTDATATLKQEGTQLSVTSIHLRVSGRVPGATSEQFEKAALEAKTNCPISRLLNTNITLETKLLTGEEGQIPAIGLPTLRDSAPENLPGSLV